MSVPWFLQVRVDFHVSTRVKFMCVNKIEAMFERPRVNVKLSDNQLLHFRAIFHTLLLFYLRVYERKSYATVRGIHLKKGYKQMPVRSIK